MFRTFTSVLFAAALLPGCASIVSPGAHQINVQSAPAGASCDVRRDDATIGTVSPTPGATTVSRSSRPLQITCRRAEAPAGAPAGQATVTAELNPWIFGNILFGGIIGFIVDASTGAISRYPETVTVAMPPVPQPVALEPVAEPASAPSGRPISALPAGDAPRG
jgi:hypothetical protein